MRAVVAQLRLRLERLRLHNGLGRPQRVRAEALAAATEAREAGLVHVAAAAEMVAALARGAGFLLREAVGPLERIVDAAEAMWGSARVRL